VQITLNQGYPDYAGRRYIFCGYSAGPTLYTAGGESLSIGQFKNYIDNVFPSRSVSGTYIGYGIPSGVGPRATWKFFIVTASTGAEASGDLSAEKFVIGGFAGVY
jgi:hypothetical protein